MESGDGRKDERISKRVPAITPVLPVPLASFPVILEADLAKCFLRGGIGTSFPRAFAPLWKGASPPLPPALLSLGSHSAARAQCCPRSPASSGRGERKWEDA